MPDMITRIPMSNGAVLTPKPRWELFIQRITGIEGVSLGIPLRKAGKL